MSPGVVVVNRADLLTLMDENADAAAIHDAKAALYLALAEQSEEP